MANQHFKLNVKNEGKDGKNYWSDCGVVFVNTDDSGNITSITVKHVMFPNVEMVAFPKRDKDEN
ncbi:MULTISPECIES: hypothetical protein [Roseobacteraceae]|uniref:hypothetical protein n=1 Tax=Roseobacteraceae TaxID=2854170 RepID=UPI0026106F2E|nr:MULTISPECIES: hypothetical protein [Roseobacteraceae]